jgi:hypothetical protein
MLGSVLGVWLLLVTIFFGFFGAKFRKKLKFLPQWLPRIVVAGRHETIQAPRGSGLIIRLA